MAMATKVTWSEGTALRKRANAGEKLTKAEQDKLNLFRAKVKDKAAARDTNGTAPKRRKKATEGASRFEVEGGNAGKLMTIASALEVLGDLDPEQFVRLRVYQLEEVDF